MTEVADDINELAWDPVRDSTNERVSLLRELDAQRLSHASDLLNPAVRTVGGMALGERRAQLLPGCTLDDLEVLTNRINADAEHEDDAELAELQSALGDFQALLHGARVLRGDLDEQAIERLGLADRRRARALLLRIESLRLERYDPITLRRRELTAAAPRLRSALQRAMTDGDDAESARLRALLAGGEAELAALGPSTAPPDSTVDDCAR